MAETEKWARIVRWCPFGQWLPNPLRALVEVGHLTPINPDLPLSLAAQNVRLNVERAWLMLDTTDARRPRLDVPLGKLIEERREAYGHPGSGWTMPMSRLTDQQKWELRLDA